MLRQFSLVILARAGVPLEANFGVGFAVNDPQAAIRERRIDFLPGQYLYNRDIEIEGDRWLAATSSGMTSSAERKRSPSFPASKLRSGRLDRAAPKSP